MFENSQGYGIDTLRKKYYRIDKYRKQVPKDVPALKEYTKTEGLKNVERDGKYINR